MSNHPKLPTIKNKNLRFLSCAYITMEPDVNQKIDDMLKHLSEREEKILRMRFGFQGEIHTLDEIGKAIGLSRERVRQIEKRAKIRLRMRSNKESLQDHLE